MLNPNLPEPQTETLHQKPLTKSPPLTEAGATQNARKKHKSAGKPRRSDGNMRTFKGGPGVKALGLE